MVTKQTWLRSVLFEGLSFDLPASRSFISANCCWRSCFSLCFTTSDSWPRNSQLEIKPANEVLNNMTFARANYSPWLNIENPAKKRRMPYNTWAHASKIRAVLRKSFSSLAMSFGKTPGRVKQITLTKLDKLMRSNTNRILRGVRWTLLPTGAWTARTIISLFSSWSTWWAPGSSLALDTTKGPQCTFGNLKIIILELTKHQEKKGKKQKS